jgi:UrcA family protein
VRKTFILAVTAAIVSIASAAAADPVSIRVPVANSDLQSSYSVAALYARVEDAAREPCRMSNRPLAMTHASCMREVVGKAIARAEIAPLTAYASTRDSQPAGRILASR